VTNNFVVVTLRAIAIPLGGFSVSGPLPSEPQEAPRRTCDHDIDVGSQGEERSALSNCTVSFKSGIAFQIGSIRQDCSFMVNETLKAVGDPDPG
jgi:hypothetical protein